jgi:hypothetical protein
MARPGSRCGPKGLQGVIRRGSCCERPASGHCPRPRRQWGLGRLTSHSPGRGMAVREQACSNGVDIAALRIERLHPCILYNVGCFAHPSCGSRLIDDDRTKLRTSATEPGRVGIGARARACAYGNPPQPAQRACRSLTPLSQARAPSVQLRTPPTRGAVWRDPRAKASRWPVGSLLGSSMENSTSNPRPEPGTIDGKPAALTATAGYRFFSAS